MVTTVAPTMPVEAARRAPTTVTARASPAGARRSRRPMASSSSSATRERWSITPMNTNSGTASSTSRVIRPNRRCGRKLMKFGLNVPTAQPSPAMANATPARTKATGYPVISSVKVTATITRSRWSVSIVSTVIGVPQPDGAGCGAPGSGPAPRADRRRPESWISAGTPRAGRWSRASPPGSPRTR